MKSVWIGSVLAITASASFAQTPVGPFTGQHSEGFDGPQQTTFAPCLAYRVFDQSADMCTPGTSGCGTFDFQFFQCLINARSAPYFFCSIDGAAQITFDFEVERFGGYFGTNTFFPDAFVDFFDASGALVGSTMASFPPDCSWNWNGWDFGPNSNVRAIRIAGFNPLGDGFVDLDDLEVDYVQSGPTVYCTSGTTTNGCQATISASGSPNVAHSTACQINVSSVEGQKSGLIFYGVSGANSVQWCSTGSSLLCVKTPTQRTPSQSSGGTVGACNGGLTLDWNAYQLSHPAALGNPWSAGALVYVQGWFRDPPSCKTTNLSNAVVLMYAP